MSSFTELETKPLQGQLVRVTELGQIGDLEIDPDHAAARGKCLGVLVSFKEIKGESFCTVRHTWGEAIYRLTEIAPLDL